MMPGQNPYMELSVFVFWRAPNCGLPFFLIQKSSFGHQDISNVVILQTKQYRRSY